MISREPLPSASVRHPGGRDSSVAVEADAGQPDRTVYLDAVVDQDEPTELAL
jgi:hypothetical protein